MHSQARNHVTGHNYKQHGRALEGQGSPGGQAWINSERHRADKESDAFTFPDGGFVLKSKPMLYTRVLRQKVFF